MYFKNDDNPNLFTRESFLDVWDAVKDSKGFREMFYWDYSPASNRFDKTIDTTFIASPHFQLEVLKWKIGADKVEKVIEGGNDE
jgi:hypothetical protein